MLSFFCFSVVMLLIWLRHRHFQRLINQHLQAEEALKAFLAEISHEIRTPLNAIIGLLEMETRQQPAESLSENIKVAFESARSLRSLIGNVLELNKIESGRYHSVPEPTLLPDLVERAVTLFRYQAEAKGVQVRMQIAVNDPCVSIDPVMINQILVNLLSNAIKFTESGQIKVALKQKAHREEFCHYLLEVSDSGCGMTTQQQQMIFEPFVQVGSRQQQLAGTGLGLTICRNLAQRLQGELNIESIPGVGSIFSFCFRAPRATWQCPRPATLSKPVAPMALKVLIADDHAPNRLLLSKQLEYAGHRVVAAESALEAFSLWQANPQRFDLIITDCNMPGMNGFQFAQAVRRQESKQHLTPVTLFGLTASAESRMVQSCLDAGMNDCLFKPLDLDTLYKHLARCVRQPDDRPALLNADASSPSPVVDATFSPLLVQLAEQDPDGCNILIRSVIASNRELLAAIQCATPGKSLSQLGHKLQGGARILNATRLASLCQKLEKHRINGANIPELVAQITQEIVLIEKYLHHFQQQLSGRKTEAE